MDLEIQEPSQYELQQACTSSFHLFLNAPSSFDGRFVKRSSAGDKEQRIRYEALYSQSLIVGARRGARERYIRIHTLLSSKQVQSSLDVVFNFNRVMQDQRIIPPVITEVEGSVELTPDRQSARTTQRSWRIVQPAKLSTAALNWRSYLNISGFSNTAHNPISAYFEPLTRDEKRAWKKGFCAGYAKGHKQANQQLSLQLSTLYRDFIGMWRFRQLELQGVVSAHIVSETRNGIKVSEDVILIDERDIRIDQATHFNAPERWRNAQIR